MVICGNDCGDFYQKCPRTENITPTVFPELSSTGSPWASSKHGFFYLLGLVIDRHLENPKAALEIVGMLEILLCAFTYFCCSLFFDALILLSKWYFPDEIDRNIQSPSAPWNAFSMNRLRPTSCFDSTRISSTLSCSPRNRIRRCRRTKTRGH